MIEARALTRRYGDFTAVHDMSFSVADGEILGILGPNGAGKTTTIRMITGFLPPTEGQVTLDGEDLHQNPIAARRKLGYLPENVALYTEMRVGEYLAYRARLAGIARSASRDTIQKAVDNCLLESVHHQIIGTLSKGFRQRVGLAAAILHGPRVLVLDEPTVGLDPKQIIAIRELIRNLGRERTLLLSTHILPEVEQLCDRVLIIDRGRLVAEGTPNELQAAMGGQRKLVLTLEGHGPEAEHSLADLPGVETVAADASSPGRFHLDCGSADPRRSIFELAVDRGWILLEMSEQRISLEDIFVRLTADQVAAESYDAPITDVPGSDAPGLDVAEPTPDPATDARREDS